MIFAIHSINTSIQVLKMHYYIVITIFLFLMLLKLHMAAVRVSLGAQVVKNLPAMQETGSIPGSGRFLEKEMATHSSILAWRIPWTEESGYCSWVLKELDTTEQLTHTWLISSQAAPNLFKTWNKGTQVTEIGTSWLP